MNYQEDKESTVMLLYKTRFEKGKEQHAYVRISYDMQNSHLQVPLVGKIFF